MRKSWQALVALALISFLIVLAPTFAQAQLQDTLDSQIQGLPVVVDGKSLFVIPDNLPGISPDRRSQKIAEQVELFAKDTLIPIDSLQVGELGGKMVIFYGSTIITEITKAEAQVAKTTPRELSYIYLQKIQEFVREYREKLRLEGQPQKTSAGNWFKQTWETISSLTINDNRLDYPLAIAYTIIATLIFIFLSFLIKTSSRQIAQFIRSHSEYNYLAIKFKGTTIFDDEQVSHIILKSFQRILAIIHLVNIGIYIALILSFFPWTRRIGAKIIEYSTLAVAQA
jgi:hypothetical protein